MFKNWLLIQNNDNVVWGLNIKERIRYNNPSTKAWRGEKIYAMKKLLYHM